MRQDTAEAKDGKLFLSGVEVELFRDRNGILTLTVCTADAEDKDSWEDGVPILRVDINDDSLGLQDDGDFVSLSDDGGAFGQEVRDRRRAVFLEVN